MLYIDRILDPIKKWYKDNHTSVTEVLQPSLHTSICRDTIRKQRDEEKKHIIKALGCRVDDDDKVCVNCKYFYGYFDNINLRESMHLQYTNSTIHLKCVRPQIDSIRGKFIPTTNEETMKCEPENCKLFSKGKYIRQHEVNYGGLSIRNKIIYE